MKIGIDISQVVYEGSGVAEYVERMVMSLVSLGSGDDFILFFTHIRADRQLKSFTDKLKLLPNYHRVTLKRYRFPIQFIEWLWNKMHIIPVEWLVGEVDVFYSSDWVEPPVMKAKKVTTIHDLSILKVPETFDSTIVDVHKRKLKWVVEEADFILCDSIATRDDAYHLLAIDKKKMQVVYPGII